MSSLVHIALDMRSPVHHSFPTEHIQAFGSGKVDRVYLTFAPDGAIEKAEAELGDAPYKRMLIDDPVTLRIFGNPGDRIDMNALHPAAKFRLDPLELVDKENGELDLASFDVGRLVNITHLPAAARFGWSENHLGKADPNAEGKVQKRVREAFISSKSKQTTRERIGNTQPDRAPRIAAPLNLTLRSVAKTRTDFEFSKFDDVLASPVGFHNRNDAERKRTKATKSPRYLFPSSPASMAPENSRLEPRKPPLPVRSSTPARKGRRNTPIPNGPQGQSMSVIYQQIKYQLPEDAQITYRDYVTVMRKEAAKKCKQDANFTKRSGSNKTYQLPTFDTEDGIAS